MDKVMDGDWDAVEPDGIPKRRVQSRDANGRERRFSHEGLARALAGFGTVPSTGPVRT